QFEEEETKEMAKTMEEYMTKTRDGYGSDANEHMEKVIEIVDLFHIPDITQDQIMLRAFPMSLTGAMIRWLRNEPFAQLNNPGREINKVNEKVYAAQVGCKLCKGPHYKKDCPLKEAGKTLEEAYYTQFGMPFPKEDNIEQQLRDSTKGIMQTLRSTRYAISASQNSKLFLEPKQVTIPFLSHLYDDCYDEEMGSYGLKDLDAYLIRITLHNDTLPQKEKDLGSFTLPCYIYNVFFEKALDDLGASVSVMPFLTYTNLGLGELVYTKLTEELADRMVKHPKGIKENVLVGIGKFVFPIDFIILDMPKDVKVPLIFERPFLSTAHAKIDVFTRKITLRVGDEKIIFKSVKLASSLIKRVYMLSLRERMELDLEARLIGEALILNRLLDPLYGDYIKLNNLNEPLELKRNQVNDLEPTIEDGEVVDEPVMDRVETRFDNEIVDGLDEYPSYYGFDRKTHIDCTFNLKFSCMIVVDNMDAYRDEGMGDIIVGRLFCKEVVSKQTGLMR
ncbi:ribonuclease H-like domain, reverse transcriptase, RNA-dependent DNA polymerase, partial [Tanacetum coccineum]